MNDIIWRPMSPNATKFGFYTTNCHIASLSIVYLQSHLPKRALYFMIKIVTVGWTPNWKLPIDPLRMMCHFELFELTLCPITPIACICSNAACLHRCAFCGFFYWGSAWRENSFLSGAPISSWVKVYLLACIKDQSPFLSLNNLHVSKLMFDFNHECYVQINQWPGLFCDLGCWGTLSKQINSCVFEICVDIMLCILDQLSNFVS